MGAVSGQFIADIDKLLIDQQGDNPAITELRDSIYQLYLKNLPSLSSRKKYIHRNNTPGYDEDQSRAFAQAGRKVANDIARIEHLHKLEATLDKAEWSLKLSNSQYLTKQFKKHAQQLQDRLDKQPFAFNNKDISDINKDSPDEGFHIYESKNPEAEIRRVLKKTQEIIDNASTIEDNIFTSRGLNELKKSHQAMTGGDVHPIASGLNALGFMWYLGASPAAAIINLTQMPTVSLPMMIASAKFKNSGKHFGTALKDKGNGKTPEEIKYMDMAAKSGLYDTTQVHDIAGVADAGVDVGSVRDKGMKLMAAMFHKAEVFNRKATYLASFRAAKDAGLTPDAAHEAARKLTWDSHLDYSAQNRARFMRGNFARVVTQFKAFSQGMYYVYGEALRKWSKGKTEAEKTEGRKLFLMLMGSQFAVGGALGLPMSGMVMGAAQGLAEAFGDEDEPQELKALFRQTLADHIGETGGDIVTKGLLNAFSPLNLSDRMSLGDMWIRTPDYDLEGKAEALSYVEALGGPMMGLFTNLFTAKEALANGDYLRAAESATPKFIKDLIRTGRYATEGNLTKKGLVVKEMTVTEMIAQALGVSSAEVAKIRGKATAIKNIESARGKRRRSLIDARLNGENNQAEIREWNKKHPRDRITAQTIRQSKQSRARYERQYTKGIRETKRNKDLIAQFDY